MADHDPETALCKIVRFNKNNPDEFETVGHLIKGEKACKRELHRLRKQESEKDKYGYYWTWVNKAAARAAAEKKAGMDPESRKKKRQNKKIAY